MTPTPLIEDADGVPYPVCGRCPDQIAPREIDGETMWIHVYSSSPGNRSYLWNCQRPHEGRYGTAENRATRKADR